VNSTGTHHDSAASGIPVHLFAPPPPEPKPRKDRMRMTALKGRQTNPTRTETPKIDPRLVRFQIDEGFQCPTPGCRCKFTGHGRGTQRKFFRHLGGNIAVESENIAKSVGSNGRVACNATRTLISRANAGDMKAIGTLVQIGLMDIPAQSDEIEVADA
jgi:hypothetical protein